jgi:ferrous iron transport protein A
LTCIIASELVLVLNTDINENDSQRSLEQTTPVITLDKLSEGSEATLLAVEGLPALRRRLMEMGLLPGTPLRLIRRMSLGGVVELEVRRSRVSIRHGEATQLLVSPV